MNRLTERDEYGNADIIGVDSEDLQLNLDFEGFNRVTEALNRLAQYEDTGLEPEQCAKYAQAEKDGRLIAIPCGDDVTLEYNGLLYKGDHWNPPSLTAFTDDPSTRSGLRVHIFRIEDAEKALDGMNNDED